MFCGNIAPGAEILVFFGAPGAKSRVTSRVQGWSGSKVRWSVGSVCLSKMGVHITENGSARTASLEILRRRRAKNFRVSYRIQG